MSQLTITCLLLAFIAAVLGFGGLVGSFATVAKVLFIVFLLVAAVSFVRGGLRSRRAGW